MKNEEPTYIDVVLPIPLRQSYTYHLPDDMEGRVVVGSRVVVQFGARKFYTALVKRIHSEKPQYKTKPVEILLDEHSVVLPVHFRFWEWVSNYYMCSEGDVMNAALPSGLKLESKTVVTINPDWIEVENLTQTEQSVYDYISQQNHVTVDQINNYTHKTNAYSVTQSLLRKGAVVTDERIKESFRPKTETYVKIAEDYASEEALHRVFDQLKRADKQLQLIMSLLNGLNFFSTQRTDSLPKKQLSKMGNYSEAAFNALIQKGFIETVDVRIDRILKADDGKLSSVVLNSYQTEAFHNIHRQFVEKQTVFLHGVTASGKTEVYIKLIEEQLREGRQVLYLLPEIALTSQIIERLKKAFGSKAGVYHSRFSDAERVEIWNKVLEGNENPEADYRLVLGTRSALFLPFNNLGLIIVDEEHDPSFKQFDPAPRYNARDAAIVLASYFDAKVLLGTATPSFESYFNAKTGKYGLVTMSKRFYDVALPQIKIADMGEAYKRGIMKSHFTPELIDEITKALEQKEQVILFQNRRGFATYVQCGDCGYIPKCSNCDVSLTYHLKQNILQCHYCGYTISMPTHCPACNSENMKTRGLGTEKVEDEIATCFPDAVVDRLDMDSTRSKNGFEKIITRFSEHKTDILIGTQMVTKGLDFENVSIVGILNADNMLNFPDFRSFERAYQLMAQVSGRAGRKHKQGSVVIQTFQPDHPVITHVINDDFQSLFMGYINERKLFNYPPWVRFINITVRHKDNDRTVYAARLLANELVSVFKNRVFGPEYPLVGRIQQLYQQIIRIKLEKQIAADEAKKYIAVLIEKVKNQEHNSSVSFVIDVDPY